tara:strand:+ start:221 stop:550 length:330 start_codon:yes stop_codon:yes gene_type:complete
MKPKEIICSKERDKIKIIFENNEIFEISAELLRVESPSAEVQGHGVGQKKIIKNKKHVKIKSLEKIGNYAIRIIFNDGHNTGIFSWELLYDFGKNHEQLMLDYNKSLNF